MLSKPAAYNEIVGGARSMANLCASAPPPGDGVITHPPVERPQTLHELGAQATLWLHADLRVDIQHVTDMGTTVLRA